MPISSAIYSQIQQPEPVSQLDSLARAYKLQDMQQGAQMNALKMGEYRRTAGRANLLTQLTSGDYPDQEARAQALDKGGFNTEAQALRKSQADIANTKAGTQRTLVDVDKEKLATAFQKLSLGAQILSSAVDQPSYDRARATAQQSGLDVSGMPPQFDPQLIAGKVQEGKTLAQQIEEKWKQKGYDTPDANAKLSAETSTANAALGNATQLKVAGIQAGTSRANNAANINKDYTLAGMVPPGAGGGAPTVSPALEAEARMVAAGKAAPPSGFAATRPQAAMLMKRVSEINPDYDATSYAAKTKAARDFSSGAQGNQLRSFAVAGNHLDQLGTLVDALDNKDTQVINRVGNYLAAQTGSPAPTNFDAVKDLVSKEIVKAIVSGGGGVAERQHLGESMDKANSPAQLQGVIKQYRDLMGAQHDALLTQRRAAGLPDSTIPDYGLSNPQKKASPATTKSGATVSGW